MARNRSLISRDALDRLKFEIAGELVPQLGNNRMNGSFNVRQGQFGPDSNFDQLKFEIAQELGVPLKPGYNGELTSRQAGRIGGKIGGNMVRRMIEIAESTLAQQN